MPSCQASNYYSEKGKCEKSFFLQLPILSLSTHQPLSAKNTGRYDSIGDKKEKKTHSIELKVTVI